MSTRTFGGLTNGIYPPSGLQGTTISGKRKIINSKVPGYVNSQESIQCYKISKPIGSMGRTVYLPYIYHNKSTSHGSVKYIVSSHGFVMGYRNWRSNEVRGCGIYTLPTWMSWDGSYKINGDRINGLFHLLIIGIISYNPLY